MNDSSGEESASTSRPWGGEGRSKMIVSSKSAASECCLGISWVADGDDGVSIMLTSSSVGGARSECSEAQGGVCTPEC